MNLAFVQKTSGRGNPTTWQSKVAGSPTLVDMSCIWTRNSGAVSFGFV